MYYKLTDNDSSKGELAIKQRFSIEKSEWSNTREEGYKKQSYDIVIIGFGAKFNWK